MLTVSHMDCCVFFLIQQRAKHDIVNAGAAGCITGAALAVRGGPQAMALGCTGFAAFSVAIEAYMER